MELIRTDSGPQKPDQVRDVGELRGSPGDRLKLGLAHDSQHFLPQVETIHAVWPPMIIAAWRHAGLEREVPELPLLLGARVLVQLARGDQKRWIAKAHRPGIQVGKEIPVERIIDQTAGPNGEVYLQVVGFSAPQEL